MCVREKKRLTIEFVVKVWWDHEEGFKLSSWESKHQPPDLLKDYFVVVSSQL